MQEEPAKSAKVSEIRLGIVCPMANEEDCAADFVEQVLTRTAQRGFESVKFFAILDRKSTDRTREILERLARTQTALLVVWAPENRCGIQPSTGGHRTIFRQDARRLRLRFWQPVLPWR